MENTLTLGVENLIASPPDWKKSRIGLLTNDGACVRTGEKSRVALVRAGFHVVRLFSPEHGIQANGMDGASMPHQVDGLTSLPVISLYQDHQEAEDQHLQDLDLLLVDLPDVGTRFYTYLWTMTYFIEAAARNGKPIVILDRPNPLGGDLSLCEGPDLHTSCRSFLGRYPMPITHQCTLGELAKYFNLTLDWKANLSVVACTWTRKQTFSQWGRTWVNPSPALGSEDAVRLYPGLCFLEATNVSIGRNSPLSFRWIGHPGMKLAAWTWDYPALSKALKVLGNNGEVISGLGLSPMEGFQFPVRFGLQLLYALRRRFSETFSWASYPTQANPAGNRHLDLLTGLPSSQDLFDADPSAFLVQLDMHLHTQWAETISPHLLYR